MIDADAIARIEARIAELGVSAAAVSKAAGAKPDLIRNWQRKVKDQGTTDAHHRHVEAVANTLGVSTAWMLYGDGPGFSEAPATLAPPPGRADHGMAPDNLTLDLRSGLLEIHAKVDRRGLEWLLATLPNYLSRLN